LIAEILYLARNDLTRLSISMPDVIAVVENAMRGQSDNKVVMPSKATLAWKRQGRLNGNSAFVENPASLGIKWNAEVPANVDEGLPNLTALLIMNDPKTGFPIAVIDGTWITAMRTGAASAISARYLAPRRVKEMALVGCGVQMRTQLLGVAPVLKPEVIRIFDLRREAMYGFAKQMSKRVGADINLCATAQQAITNADVAISATKFVIPPEPTLKGEWVKPGALVMPIDVASVWDASTYLNADKFITDRWDILNVVAASGHFPHGLPKLYAELHEIVTGKKVGRESDDELIVVMNEGMPIEDVAMGRLAYDRAVVCGGVAVRGGDL
jgi:ornithine cyclodeaminase/alanine dehydrogenase-like protein (mu-crystallin family)